MLCTNVVDIYQVIDNALSQIETWQTQGLHTPGLHTPGLHTPVSVNVGAYQLQQANFVARLRILLARYPQVDPADLTLEILETSALRDIPYASLVIEDCRQMGVAFALDDFGTGYCLARPMPAQDLPNCVSEWKQNSLPPLVPLA